MPANLINSVIFFKRDGFRDRPEFSPEIEYPQTWLKLVPREYYTQIIELDTDFKENTQVKLSLFWDKLDAKDVTEPLFSVFGKALGGKYVVICFNIWKDFLMDCATIRLTINGIDYESNKFTCTEENRKFTSLVTYSHQEPLYGIPYTSIKPIFCQIRIPAFFKRKTPTAEADTGYMPITKPYEAVARIQRTFKQEWEVVATDNLNEALCSIFDCDFIYLNRQRIIADPYVPEPLDDDGHPFSRSTLTIQELDEVFDGMYTLDFCEAEYMNLQNLTYKINRDITSQEFIFNWELPNAHIPITKIRIYFRESGATEWLTLAELEPNTTTFTLPNFQLGFFDFRFETIGICDDTYTWTIDSRQGFDNIGRPFCENLQNLTYENYVGSYAGGTGQYFIFNWELPPTPITRIRIYYKLSYNTLWVGMTDLSPKTTYTTPYVPLGLLDFRFELVGSCDQYEHLEINNIGLTTDTPLVAQDFIRIVENRDTEYVFDYGDFDASITAIIIKTLPARGKLTLWISNQETQDVVAGQEISPPAAYGRFLYRAENTDEAYTTSIKYQIRNQEGLVSSNQGTVTFNVRFAI